MAQPSPLFRRVAVIGLGLIGGSLASAIRAHGLAQTVVGYDARADELALGVALGVIDQAADSLAQAVRGSDLVMLAVPVRAARSVLAEIRPVLGEDAILSDVGSTKASFVAGFDVFKRSVIDFHPLATAF